MLVDVNCHFEDTRRIIDVSRQIPVGAYLFIKNRIEMVLLNYLVDGTHFCGANHTHEIFVVVEPLDEFDGRASFSSSYQPVENVVEGRQHRRWNSVKERTHFIVTSL